MAHSEDLTDFRQSSTYKFLLTAFIIFSGNSPLLLSAVFLKAKLAQLGDEVAPKKMHFHTIISWILVQVAVRPP